MRYVLIFCLASCWQLCLAQRNKYDDRTLKEVAFYGQSDTVDTYEIRILCDNIWKEFPYYALLGSQNHKFIHYEFCRIDTMCYYVREYFKGSSLLNQDLKSYGKEAIEKKASDSVLVDDFSKICGDKTNSYLVGRHFLTKKGVWTEFENFTEQSVFWHGEYFNNTKTGVWKRELFFDEDTISLEEIDYKKDSTKVYGDNVIREKSLPDLEKLLIGNWLGVSDNGKGMIRSFKNSRWCYYHYRYECYMESTHYEFDKSGNFINYFGEAYRFNRKPLDHGTWRLRKEDNRTFIDLTYSSGKKYEMDLLYYSNEKGLFTSLHKHRAIKIENKKPTVRDNSPIQLRTSLLNTH